MAHRKKNVETESAMQRVWKRTASVCSLRCRGTFRGAKRIPLECHLCPAFRPLTSSVSFSFLLETSKALAGLTLVICVPFFSSTSLNTMVFSLSSGTFFSFVYLDPLVCRTLSAVLRPSWDPLDPLLFCDGVFRCLCLGGLLGVSSRPC
jgi:hypothetical protein